MHSARVPLTWLARACRVDCYVNAPQFRLWLEDVLYEHGVDVLWQAHEHSYERMWPVHNEVPEHSYVNPNATVYIMNGAAVRVPRRGAVHASAECSRAQGNVEGHDPEFLDPPEVWSAYRNGTNFGCVRAPLAT